MKRLAPEPGASFPALDTARASQRTFLEPAGPDMKLMLKTACSTVAIAAFAGMLALGSPAQAQERGADAAAAEGNPSWYYGSSRPAETYTVAQQKAMARAAARTARLESSRWYGFHHSRPTATAMAFTSMYSPAWQMPGARPFAWYHGNRGPVVIIR